MKPRTALLLLSMLCAVVLSTFASEAILAAEPSTPVTIVRRPPPIATRPSLAALKAYGQLLMQAQINRAPVSGGGTHCYSTHYPSTALTEVPCLPESTTVYMVRRLRTDSAPAPQTAGAGTDFFATVTNGSTTGVIGSFPTVNVKSEAQTGSGTPQPIANSYSIQINPNNYTSPRCTNANGMSVNGCTGATVQFVYGTGECNGTPCLELEYWLFNVPKKFCPTDPTQWSFYDGSFGGIPGCFLNVKGAPIAAISWPELSSAQFIALATSATDFFFVVGADGGAGMVQSDSDGLSTGGWVSTEFNLVGDGDGSEATFSDGTSTLGLNLAVQFQQTAGSNQPASLSCSPFAGGDGDSTGESNNLNLGTCTISGNNMQFSETGGIPAAAPLSCAQISADIALELKIIANLTNNPPPCPSHIVAECDSQLRGAQAVLTDLRASYAAQHCQPPHQ
jgi:hypothetical protein